MMAFAAFGSVSQVPVAQADIDDVWILDDCLGGACVSISTAVPDRISNSVKLAEYGLAGSDLDFTDNGSCGDADNSYDVDDEEVGSTSSVDIVVRQVSTSGNPRGVWICVDLDDDEGDDGTDSADVTFDSDDVGTFTEAICGNNDDDGDNFELDDDECISTEGLNTDELIVDCSEQPGEDPCDEGGSDEGGILVYWQCPTTAVSTIITITSKDGEDNDGNARFFRVQCRGALGGITVTAAPTTVEIIPAPSNTSHSLIQVTATDSAGNPVLVFPSTDVDFATDRCAIEEGNVDNETELHLARGFVAALSTALPGTYSNWEAAANQDDPGSGTPFSPDTTGGSDNSSFYDVDLAQGALGQAGAINRSMAAAILHCDPHSGIAGATPGVATVLVCAEVLDGADICKTVTVTVIGPPASITVAASPTALRCGEKSTITVTVKDAIGQNVSDHTPVELVTNLGGTIGGTGGVAAGFGLVSPISSNGASTFGGVATAFLLTSESHSGPYEVVATTGGTAPLHDFIEPGLLLGVFSTPPISAQVTVTCTIPAPVAPTAAAITAPRTGTGIIPPNTGDAGLLGSSSSSWTLFAIGGMAAFALAGLATLKFARR
jgi:hypothetical protein